MEPHDSLDLAGVAGGAFKLAIAGDRSEEEVEHMAREIINRPQPILALDRVFS